MAAPGVDKQDLQHWYSALFAEDCVQVKKLLTKDGRLLNEGWTADAQASSQFQLQRGWKGRTAVHVAARRGDVALMQLILNLYFQKLDEGEVKGEGCSSYSHLLELIDSAYGLDALAMAVVNGNKDIANLLVKAIQSDSLSTWSHISHEVDIGHEVEGRSTRPEDREMKTAQVMKITEEILGDDNKYPNATDFKRLYYEDYDFNFLEINLYFFHFTFSKWKPDRGLDLEPVQAAIFARARENKVLEYLLYELWDGQGRTPLHVAVDSRKVDKFVGIIPPPGEVVNRDDDYLNKTDRAGRTPLYRAAAKNSDTAVVELLNDPRTNVLAETICSAKQWGAAVDIDRLSRRNGFKSDCVYVPEEKLRMKAFDTEGNNARGGSGPGLTPLEEISSTALHVAIIHRHTHIVELLLDPQCRPKRKARIRATAAEDANEADDRSTKRCTFQSSVHCVRRFTWPRDLGGGGYDFQRSATPMQLTVFVGSSRILYLLLKEKDESYDQSHDVVDASFLLAASTGKPSMIERFLDRQQGGFNPLIKDSFDNTALHHAVRGKNIQVYPHLVDFVGCDHIYKWRHLSGSVSQWLANPDEASPAVGEDKNLELQTKYGQRKRSINLLVEAGINMWEKNGYQRMATPESDSSDEFVRWYYDKVSQETQRVQEKLNGAANAISVTAALVATASYVGPLQPPLGYGGASGVQVHILAVRIFVVCDSLSFYLALAAIMLALLPSLPSAQDSVFRELARTRVFVAMSVAFLFPSIICVLLAFAASYVAVIPDDGLAYHGLTMATTVVGGFLCLLVMRFFAARLLKVLRQMPVDINMEIRRFSRDIFLFGPLSPISKCFKKS